MTIPIIPGPFNFLEQLGRGVGTAYQVAEEQKRQIRTQEQQDRAEASAMLKWIYENASKPDSGLKANVLTSPAVQSLIQRSGLSDFFTGHVAPQPGQEIREVQSERLRHLRSNQTPANSRELQHIASQGRIVSEGEAQTDRTTGLVQQTRGNTIQAGGAAGRAAAGVQADAVAAAAEHAAQDPQFSSMAGRMVDATMTNLRVQKIDNSNISAIADQAWRLAQQDARSRGFILDEQITRPYIDSVLQQRLRKQEEAEIERLRATTRGGTDPGVKLIEFYQRQQQRVNDAMKTLNDSKPDTVKEAFAAGISRLARETRRTVEQVLADPKTPEENKKAYYEVMQYQSQLQSLQAEAQGYRDNIGQLLGGRVGVPDPSAVPVPSERRVNPPGPGSFQSPPAPDAGGAILAQKRRELYLQLKAEELKKPPAQRRWKTQQELMDYVEEEIPDERIDRVFEYPYEEEE